MHALKANSKFLIGFNVGKRNTLREKVLVNVEGRQEVLSAKNLEWAKEMIETLDRRVTELNRELSAIQQMQLRPRYRVRAGRAA